MMKTKMKSFIKIGFWLSKPGNKFINNFSSRVTCYASLLSNFTFMNPLKPLDVLKECTICPRDCKANRFSDRLGYCKADASFRISTICNHMGEEPVISGPRGICNIFFTNCNLQCVFCQNYQISDNRLDHRHCVMELDDIIRQIGYILNMGMNIVGFVSPTHFTPHLKVIVKALHDKGIRPTIVYNSNGYDKVDTLKELEGLVDVYLPDFKYMDPGIAGAYSDARDYPEVALAALKEMYRQKGPSLVVDNQGYAMTGIIIRHLVLPGHRDNSIEVLKTIADKVSNRLHISLMSQYHPNHRVHEHLVLGNTVKPKDYYAVVDAMAELGFSRGWVQEMSSAANYLPDFRRKHPFEKT